MDDPLSLPPRNESATIEQAPWEMRIVIEPPSVDVVRGTFRSFQIGRIDTQQAIDSSEAREIASVLLSAADEVDRRNSAFIPAALRFLEAVEDCE